MKMIGFFAILFLSLILAGLIVLIVVTVQKRQLKKRLEEDRNTLEAGGTPSGRGLHRTMDSSAISGVVVWICVFCSIVFLCVFLTNRMTEQTQESFDAMKKQISELRTQISAYAAEMKKGQSLFSSLKGTYVEESYDAERMTDSFLVEIVPKETADDTAITVQMDGRTIETERAGNVFSFTLTKSVFADEDALGGMTVTVSTGGTTRTETLTLEDSDCFPDLYGLLRPTWQKYMAANLIWEWEDEKKHRRIREFKNGEFAIDYRMNLVMRRGEPEVVGCSFRLEAGDRVLMEEDLTSRMQKRETEDTVVIPEVEIKGEWSDLSGAYVDQIWQITYSNGYVLTQHDRWFSKDSSGMVYPLWRLTDAEGNVILSE